MVSKQNIVLVQGIQQTDYYKKGLQLRLGSGSERLYLTFSKLSCGGNKTAVFVDAIHSGGGENTEQTEFVPTICDAVGI